MQLNRRHVALIALLTAAFAVRIAFCAYRGTLGESPAGHYREYVTSASRLLAHGILVSPMILDEQNLAPSSLMPPAYVALVAIVYKVFGIETTAATLVLQAINALATTLAVLMVFLIARRLGGERAGWVAALIAAANPLLYGYTDVIWDTSLLTLAVGVTVWFVLYLSERPVGWRVFFFFGLWLGALAMLNPALSIAYPVIVLWPMIRLKSWTYRRLTVGVAAAVLGWAMAITPWTVRNYGHSSQLLYIRSGFMLELWLGVCPEADTDGAAVYPNQYPLNNDEVQKHITEIGETAFIAECGERAKDAIAKDPLRFLRLCAVRAVDYWTGSAFSHARPGDGGIPRSTQRVFVMIFLSLELLVAAGLMLLRRPLGSDVVCLLAIVVLCSLIYHLTHMQIRYRAPIEPLVAVILGVLACRPAAPAR